MVRPYTDLSQRIRYREYDYASMTSQGNYSTRLVTDILVAVVLFI